MCRRLATISVLCVLALLSCSSPARAESIDFLGLGKYSVVEIAGPESGWVYAGELNWSGLGQTFYSYCVDILSSLADPQDVTLKSTDGLVSGNGTVQTVAEAGEKAAWLFNTYAGLIHTSGTGPQAAALQVAIWEAIYDTTGSLSTGVFSLTNSIYNVTVRTIADGYLNALYQADYSSASAVWLDTTRGQDQITRVPEPATITLLGLGLAALVAPRRGRLQSA